jgi:hypothetical protein
MMSLALIGLPQSGKKTVFRLLTGHTPEKAPRRAGMAFGIAPVRDPRIDRLVEMYHPQKTRYAEFEIVLAPDITPEAARGAEWLTPLRAADALLLVARSFRAPEVFHLLGSLDPERDVRLVETELLLADLELVEKRLERMLKDPKRKANPNYEHEEKLLARLQAHLEGENSLRTLPLSPEDRALISSLQLLTLKPLVIVLNADENLAEAEARFAPLAERMRAQGAALMCLSAAIEQELRELPPEEQTAFMADLGIGEPAAHRLSRTVIEHLGLICFFTVGPDEVRAWPIVAGTLAPAAAGKIHTDLERGFIRADTVAYAELVAAGSEKAAREANRYHLHGKDYVVQDGDVIEIRFNV